MASFLDIGRNKLLSTSEGAATPDWLSKRHHDRKFSTTGGRRSALETPLLSERMPSFVFDSGKLPTRTSFNANSKQVSLSFQALIGLISGSVMVPTLVGYTSIVFQDPFFAPFFPTLMKLMFFSSAVHQIAFIFLSTLPFAVGQVQDAGLIFLSAMATKILASLAETEISPEDKLTTVLVGLSLSTASLGAVLVLLGKFKLASLVQYLPLPVIGGYLAFIGLFCGDSGLRLMTNDQGISGLGGLQKFIVDLQHNSHLSVLVLPGFICAALLYVLPKKIKHQMVFPSLLFSFPIIFYLVLLVSGVSVDEARSQQWISEPSEIPDVSSLLEVFDFRKRTVHWTAIFPGIVPEFLAMTLVVCFGSCLDVAAVQFELGKPLSYDTELQCVGFSNIFSGLTGGFTGSYIFSQTIMALRNGVNSRISSWFVVLFDVAVVFFPVDLMGILPRFFFGSVLLYIAEDLMFEWLFFSYHHLEKKEFLLVWASFIAINATSLEVGMLIGSVLTAMMFVFDYANISARDLLLRAGGKQLTDGHAAQRTSFVVRDMIERMALETEKNRIVVFSLSGSQFFGTTQSVLRAVKRNIIVPFSEEPIPLLETPDDMELDRSSAILLRRTTSNMLGSNQKKRYKRLDSTTPEPLQDSDDEEASNLKATLYVIMDMSQVTSVDATAARGCFLTLLYVLSEVGIDLVFTGMKPKIRRLFETHGIVSQEIGLEEDEIKALYFETFNEAVDFCEDQMSQGLSADGPQEPPKRDTGNNAGSGKSKSSLGGSNSGVAVFDYLFGSGPNADAILKCMVKKRFSPGEFLFHRGHEADELFLLFRGRVKVQEGDVNLGRKDVDLLLCANEFLMKSSYTYSAQAIPGIKGTKLVVYSLSRERFEKLSLENPSAALVIHQAALKSSSN